MLSFFLVSTMGFGMQDTVTYEYTSMKSLNEAKYGFWGFLARKAKSILEDDNATQQFEDHDRSHLQMPDTLAGGQVSDICICQLVLSALNF